MSDEMDDNRRELINQWVAAQQTTEVDRRIWANVLEIMQQLDLENPSAGDKELMRLLVRELTERLDRPKTEPEAEG